MAERQDKAETKLTLKATISCCKSC